MDTEAQAPRTYIVQCNTGTEYQHKCVSFNIESGNLTLYGRESVEAIFSAGSWCHVRQVHDNA